MKKFLYLAALSVLLSGCGIGVAHLAAGEDPGGEFAYVTGKYTGPSEYIRFAPENRPFFPEFTDADYTIVIINSDNDYKVQKVHPGRYHLYSIELPNSRVLARTDEKPIVTVELEPGKITYLGDIGVFFVGGTPGLLEQNAAPLLSYTDNSDKVKKAILKANPGLAGKLDTIFVFKRPE